MKTLEKAEMLERNKVTRVLTEERILGTVDHPFLATLYATIKTESHLHFILEFCEGGELYALLQAQPGKRFKESHMRFYCAEARARSRLGVEPLCYRGRGGRRSCARRLPLAGRRLGACLHKLLVPGRAWALSSRLSSVGAPAALCASIVIKLFGHRAVSKHRGERERPGGCGAAAGRLMPGLARAGAAGAAVPAPAGLCLPRPEAREHPAAPHRPRAAHRL